MRRPGLAAALAVAALALGGCGIPLSQGAQPVSSRNLPPVLSGTTPSSTTTTTTLPAPSEHAQHLEIYLVDRDGTHLVAVRRPWQQQVTPIIALGLLALGPNSVDSRRGLQTQLGAAPKFEVSVGKKTGIATVTLDVSTFSDLFGSNLYVPLAQIVYTLMENFSYIKGIDFYLAGSPPELFNYTPSGSTSLSPVTEETYHLLAPLPAKKR